MDDREKADAFKEALSDILNKLPLSQAVNTTLYLKSNNPESIFGLVRFWTKQSNYDFCDLCSLLGLSEDPYYNSGPIKIVDDFLKTEQPIVTAVADYEYQKWSNNGLLPFTPKKC